MTDPRTPPDPGPVDPDVELASAHLDGEVAPAERARADDPAVQAHLVTLSSVAGRVRDVPPAPAGLVDEHVARALQDFDAGRTVVALDAHRTRWWDRIPLGAVAAVLVIVAFVGFAGLASRNGGDDDTAATSLDSSDDSAESTDAAGGEPFGTTRDGGTEAVEEGAASGTADVSAPAAPAVYDSLDDLADDLRAELDGSEPAADEAAPTSDEAVTTEDAGPSDPCGAVDLLGLDPATVVLVRSVLVTADQVTVVVHDATDGRRLIAVDGTCAVVLDRLL